MKNIIILLFLTISTTSYGQLAVGTTRKTVTTDTNGVVLNTPIVFTNQVSMTVAASTANQLARYADVTNSIASTTATTVATATAAAITAVTNGANTWTSNQIFNGGVVVSPTQNFQSGTNTVRVIEAYGTVFTGGTDATVARFATINKNTGEGTAWNYTTNAANAAKITILQDGIYSGTATLCEETAVYNAAEVYWTLNADANLLHLDPSTYSTGTMNLACSFVTDSGFTSQAIANASFTCFLPSNSVVRVQTVTLTASTVQNRMIFQQILRK